MSGAARRVSGFVAYLYSRVSEISVLGCGITAMVPIRTGFSLKLLQFTDVDESFCIAHVCHIV